MGKLGKQYKNLYEVYQVMAATNPQGKSNKKIAMEVWPDRGEEKAKELLSKCISPLYEMRNFKPKELERFIGVCGNSEILINYLCDRYGLERPTRKLILTPDKELKIIRQMAAEGIVPTDDAIQEYIKEHKGIIQHMEEYKGVVSLDVKKHKKPKKSLLRRVADYEIW